MLSLDELAREAEHFGVAEQQVRRDHAISHALAALSRGAAQDVIFFGGTALSRTHALAARLSEDIDLIARRPREQVVATVRQRIEQGLLRSHGRITWNPDFTTNDVDAAVLDTPDGISIKLQVLGSLGHQNWPVEMTAIDQRYSDAAPARLYVPTAESFAGWKTSAWLDWHAARDLYDLWALAERGHLTPEAAELFIQHGPTNGPPKAFMFDTAPTEREWTAQLAGQTRLTVTAADAIEVVRQAWASAVGPGWD